MTKRILITGATGFIGRHALGPLADRGFEIYALARDTARAAPAERVLWIPGNVLDMEATRRAMGQVQPTHLLHLAWYTVPGQYWSARENFAWTQASLDLLRSFHDAGGHRVVMVGTCAEYDWELGLCSETVTPLAPHTTYGICKHALQSLLAAYTPGSGLTSAWGRVFFLYGPHEHPARLVPSVTRALLRGEPAQCTAGTQQRDFLHVQDVADAFVALLDSEVQGPVNIASGQPIPVSHIVSHLADVIGRPDLLHLGAIPLSPTESPLVYADVQRLRDEVGWSPSIDLISGLRNTVTWWQHHMKEEMHA